MMRSGIVLYVIISFCMGYSLAYSQNTSLEVIAQWKNNKGITIVIFLKEECPICQKYAPTLRDIYHRFSSDSVRFFGIFSDRTPDTLAIRKYCRVYNIPFPVLIDSSMALAEYTDARITPEVAVIVAGRVVYKGRIDDWFISWGRKRNAPRHHTLVEVLNDLQSGRSVKDPITQAIGCAISR